MNYGIKDVDYFLIKAFNGANLFSNAFYKPLKLL